MGEIHYGNIYKEIKMTKYKSSYFETLHERIILVFFTSKSEYSTDIAYKLPYVPTCDSQNEVW